MPRKISQSVIVITGASSGIGRATALQIAQMGGAPVWQQEPWPLSPPPQSCCGKLDTDDLPHG